jgi:hypothetical protein
MERLNALGERLQAPKPPEQSAGDAFLGPELTGIARRLDAEWLEEHGAAWSERDAIVRGAVRRLKELDAEQGAPASSSSSADACSRSLDERVTPSTPTGQALNANRTTLRRR